MSLSRGAVPAAGRHEADHADRGYHQADLPEWHENELEFGRIAQIVTWVHPEVAHGGARDDHGKTDGAKQEADPEQSLVHDAAAPVQVGLAPLPAQPQ